MEHDPYLYDAEGLEKFLDKQTPKILKQEREIATLPPLKILHKIFNIIRNEQHYMGNRCWDLMIELIASFPFEGLLPNPIPHIMTTTQYPDLLDKCSYLIEKFIEKAREAPDDYFGNLWVHLELRGNNGQMLTPIHVCDMIIQMTIGEKQKEIEKVMEPCFGTGRFYISLNKLFPPPERHFILFAVEIDVSRYRAGCLNMKLFSKHPYSVICGDTLRLPHTTNAMHPIWDLGNRWNPPDMQPFYDWVEKRSEVCVE